MAAWVMQNQQVNVPQARSWRSTNRLENKPVSGIKRLEVNQEPVQGSLYGQSTGLTPPSLVMIAVQAEDDSPPPPRAKGSAGQMAGPASKYLDGLPSRGLLSSSVLFSNPSGIRVYVCDHETAPPEGQLIKTNPTNILIRALLINTQKSGSKDVTAKSTTDSSTGKRSSVRTSEGRPPPKKMKMKSASTSSHRGSSSTEFSEKVLQTMTVERLRALLKERGFSPKGKKDELIARLKDQA